MLANSKMQLSSGLISFESSSMSKSGAGQGLTDNDVQQKLEKMKMAFKTREVEVVVTPAEVRKTFAT